MRLRRWISFLALLGVWAHAYALVRHNVYMATAEATAARGSLSRVDAHAAGAGDLLADLAVICHGAGEAKTDGAPLKPGQNPGAPACPMCAGLAPLAAIAAADQALAALPLVAGRRLAAADVELNVFARIRPQSRGPPLV